MYSTTQTKGMTLGCSADAPIPLHDSRRRVRPITASRDINPESRSVEKLGRRELRYVRDREGLRASLSRCTEEPSAEQLQIRALERVKYELEDRIRDYETRIEELRNRLARPDSRESLHRQRLIVEHGLALSREEVKAVNKELGRLKFDIRSSRENSVDRPSSSSSDASRSKANLSLFFQDSPTRRPLPKSTRPYSADYIRHTNPSHLRKLDQGATHLRSKSLTKGYAMDKPHVDGDQRTRPAPSAPCIDPAGSSRWTDSRPIRLVPAVDEFSNSFSSRVIAPSSSRPKPRSSLRNLQVTSRERERERMFPSRSRRSSVDRPEYGNITLLPHVEPRSSVDLLDDLPNVPLPSYVHSLMSEFERASQPSLTFSLTEDKIPDTRGLVPLSPVLEQPSPIPSIKSHLSTKSTGRKLMKKRHPIFTLRLPTRPPAPGACSLAASSSTSFDASSDEHPLPAPFVETTVPLRPKGLPSTRDHDLAMLGVAPDDIRETPLCHEPAPPTVKRSSLSIDVLRRVKSRLVQLGRF